MLDGHGGAVLGALLLPDGGRALSWSGNRTLRLWDLDSTREQGCYFADARITVVAVDGRGRRAFVGDALGGIHVVRIAPASRAAAG